MCPQTTIKVTGRQGMTTNGCFVAGRLSLGSLAGTNDPHVFFLW